jgi:hypothetical protein
MEEAVRRRFEKIEAILQDVAERQTAAEERADARMDRMDARCEKRMRGFEKLVKIGMGELAELRRFNRQFSKETDHKINALIDSQQRTEASLRAFLDSRRGRNGGSN